jgi:enamine deaminase RidA (YjgF/YER057c/UK114 family)
VADHLFVLCCPTGGGRDAARQAEEAYDGLRDALASAGMAPEAVVAETLYVGRVHEHVAAARAARTRVFGDVGIRPATTVIGQPPIDADAALALAAVAVVSHSPGSSTREVRVPMACACPGCAPGAHARVLRLRGQTSLWTGNVYGSGGDAFEEASDMFRVAERLLAGAGMRFADVMRTWIHVRDIDRDYEALNQARRAFFRDRGIARRPASTGVQGTPFPDAHAFSLGLYALASDRTLDIAPMSTPSLNEAWSYGADFSRGLRVADANQTTLYVSGTASVDAAGRTVHVGDFAAQVDRMLHNITSLLERQGAGIDDLVSGVTYLKHARDGRALREIFRTRGFDRFPCALVEAPLCRPELLCEVEAMAVLPLTTAGA